MIGGRGVLPSEGGGSAWEGLHGTTPGRDTVNWRSVRILLECILVLTENIDCHPTVLKYTCVK